MCATTVAMVDLWHAVLPHHTQSAQHNEKVVGTREALMDLSTRLDLKQVSRLRCLDHRCEEAKVA